MASIAPELKEIKKRGRGIRRLVTLCGPISHLLAENDWRILAGASRDGEDINELDNEDDDDQRSEKKEEIKR